MPDPTLTALAADLSAPGITVGAMFGKPTLKDAAGKAFACLFDGDLACRLGRDTAPTPPPSPCPAPTSSTPPPATAP